MSWTETSEPRYGQSYGVFLEGTGTPGAAFLLGNAPPTVTQERDFAPLAPGLVLEVFDSLGPWVRTPPLWGRLFDAESGSLLTEEPFVVGRAEQTGGPPTGVQVDLAVCADGSFAVTWTADNHHPLFARAFGSDLQPRSPAVRFDDAGTLPADFGPKIACGPGGWAVVWIDGAGQLQVGLLDDDGRFRRPEEPLVALESDGDNPPPQTSDLALTGDNGGWAMGFDVRAGDGGEPFPRHTRVLHVGPDGVATGPSFPLGSPSTTDLGQSRYSELAFALDGDDLVATWRCREGSHPGVGEPLLCARAFTRRDGRFLPLEEPTPLVLDPVNIDPWDRMARTSAGYLVTWIRFSASPSSDPHPVWRRLVPPPATDLLPLTDEEVHCLARHALDRVPLEPKDAEYCHPVELTDEDAERAAWLLSLFEARAGAEDGGICAVALHRTAGIDSFRLHATAGDGSRLTADVRLIFRQSGELDGLRLTPQPACPAVAEGEPYPLDCSLPDNAGRLPRLSVVRDDREGSLRPLRLRPGRAVYLEAERLPSRSERKATSQASSSSRLGHSSGSGEFP